VKLESLGEIGEIDAVDQMTRFLQDSKHSLTHSLTHSTERERRAVPLRQLNFLLSFSVFVHGLIVVFNMVNGHW